jgi:hypothetical protein
MEHAELFLEALDRKAKPFAASARTTFEANKELCSWLLNPLARWAEAAYGKGIRRCSVRVCQVLLWGRAGPKGLRARGQVHSGRHAGNHVRGLRG